MPGTLSGIGEAKLVSSQGLLVYRVLATGVDTLGFKPLIHVPDTMDLEFPKLQTFAKLRGEQVKSTLTLVGCSVHELQIVSTRSAMLRGSP